MKKKVISTLLCASMLASMVAGCGVQATAAQQQAPETSSSSTESMGSSTDSTESAGGSSSGSLAYTGDLEIMHFSTEEESQGNGGSDGMRTVITAVG